MSKEFFWLIVAALAIAVPATHIIIGNWLNRFSERTSINVTPFLISGAAVMIIAWLSASLISWKAARANVVDALREE